MAATEMEKLDNDASAMGGRHLRDLEDRLEEQSAATTQRGEIHAQLLLNSERGGVLAVELKI